MIQSVTRNEPEYLLFHLAKRFSGFTHQVESYEALKLPGRYHPNLPYGMVFGIISRTKACSATNEVSKSRFPERALLRHNIIGVRLLTSARRAKMPKQVALKAKMHVNTGSSLLLVQKTDNYAKNDKRHCLRLNHAMHAITS